MKIWHFRRYGYSRAFAKPTNLIQKCILLFRGWKEEPDHSKWWSKSTSTFNNYARYYQAMAPMSFNDRSFLNDK